MTIKNPIVIDEERENHWTVRCGDRYQGELCHDEVLFVVASVLIRGPEKALRTAEEHRTDKARAGAS